MERIKALIDKLYQQKEEDAAPAQLLLTIQLLQAELVKMQPAEPSRASSKVAVTLPLNFPVASVPQVEEVKSQDKEIFTLEPLDADLEEAILKSEALEEELRKSKMPPVAISTSQSQPAVPAPSQPYSLQKPVVEEPAPVQQAPEPPAPQREEPVVLPKMEEPVAPTPAPEPRVETPPPAPEHAPYYPAYGTTDEAPTLTQHQVKEVHELIAPRQESLNDRLKQEQKELAHALKDSPIKDLRKGVGINDRFTFVNELFRGDEAMYERSIKTINNFNILSEAEYWISRELKYKLGWDDSRDAVQHFYQLVRRRFS